MGMVVRTNTMAVNAYRQLGMNNSAVSKSLEKLASGYRINRAGDDAAGLAISEKMKAQITGLETASANAQDGISLIQTAEGNLSEVHDMLNRMVELATKSANGTYTSTERDALQAEVDQLLDEIDRISQSANFNGTRLLDGTMGLNQDAFKSFTNVDAVKAHDGKLTGADICAKEADGSPKVHLEGSEATAAAPSAVIDLGNLSVGFAGGKKGSITLTIAGQDFTVENDDSATPGNAGVSIDFATKNLTGLLLPKLFTVNIQTGKPDANAANNSGMRIGDAVFSVAKEGDTAIKLTYKGRFDGENYKMENTFSGTAEQAEAINNSLGFDVVVKETKDATVISGTDVVHKATNVERASAAGGDAKAGIDIDLAKIVGQGNSLTIDGKTFVFQTEKDNVPTAADGSALTSPATGAAGGLIDVSSAKSQEEAIHMAADALSKLTVTGTDSRTWKVGVNGDGTTIHIDQAVASATKKHLDTYEKLVKVIGAQVAPTEAANAATKIETDASKLVAGDSISIGGKTYTFGDGEGQIKLGEDNADALTNLQKALEADGYKATVAKDGKSITVQSQDAKATTGPAAIGAGLTLQIGDTADDFNKMTVGVANMSSGALGLGGLKITSEVLASDAIDKVKNAINSVSSTRATMGALQNRLEHTINNLDVAAENLSAANSRIRDTDMAKEMMNYTKMNVLVQSAQAMLAQANQQPQSVLQLLQ